MPFSTFADPETWKLSFLLDANAGLEKQQGNAPFGVSENIKPLVHHPRASRHETNCAGKEPGMHANPVGITASVTNVGWHFREMLKDMKETPLLL